MRPYLISLLLMTLVASSALLCGAAGFNLEDPEVLSTILWDIRLPRIAVAAVCGAAQGIAGALCQGLFRNSLASPSILGTAQGAIFAGVFAFYAGGLTYTWYSLPLAAALGAGLTTAFLFMLLKRGLCPSLTHLLVLGFALSSLLGALTSLILSLALADYQKAMAMMYWLMGGFSGASWQHVWAILPPFVAALLSLGGGLPEQLNVHVLGEEVASSVGIDPERLKNRVIVAIALLVGTSVCVGGGLPFVSLMVPHIVRIFVGGEHRRLFVLSGLNGISLAVGADILARTLHAPVEIEVGIFTALLGAPFFIYLLWRQQKNHALL
jgi:iron complex transport system permease protein